MTLNITAVVPFHIIQVSDRRMVEVSEGRMSLEDAHKDDFANKALVVACDDGTFAITFAGVGRVREQRTDLWLADRLLDQGGPDLPVEQMIEVICGEATKWFRSSVFGRVPDICKLHTFLVAGWRKEVGSSTPAFWLISNCAAEDGRLLSAPEDFRVIATPVPKGGNSGVISTGLHRSLPRADRRRMKGALKRPMNVDHIEEVLVNAIQSAASDDTKIGGHCMAVALAPDGSVRATYHSPSHPTVNHMPLFLWHEAGKNWLMGDAQVSPPGAFCRFGGDRFTLKLKAEAIDPSQQETTQDLSQVVWRQRVTPSRHKPSDGKPAQVVAVEFHPGVR